MAVSRGFVTAFGRVARKLGCSISIFSGAFYSGTFGWIGFIGARISNTAGLGLETGFGYWVTIGAVFWTSGAFYWTGGWGFETDLSLFPYAASWSAKDIGC
jgi:hypothetical protein